MRGGFDGLFGWVSGQVDDHSDDIIDLCSQLVAAPSVNPSGDTREVAEVVTHALTERGIASRQEWCDPTMPSVLAHLDSRRAGPHLVLNVHLDTMPPGDESLWTVPPWQLTQSEGRLYGLGMGNMKGAVAAMVTATGLLGELGEHWRGQVTFTAVSDEVVFGENGAAHLLREHSSLYGDALICGEGPGYRRLALGEKGVLWLQLRAAADPGHSSAVRAGASAAARIAEAVSRIDALTGRRGELPQELHGLAGLDELGTYGTGSEGDNGSGGCRNRQESWDSGLQLTANVGTIRAGTFVGQIATEAVAEVDLRLPPGLSADDVTTLVREQVSDIDSVTVTRLKGWDPNWTSPDTALTRAWVHSSNAVTGADPTYAIRLPASDASRWRRNGVPALCYGPQPTLSAGVDDYAETAEVIACAKLYTLTALELLQRGNRRGQPGGPTLDRTVYCIQGWAT
jgi:succinyl-diaminopimelate desuccinylase